MRGREAITTATVGHLLGAMARAAGDHDEELGRAVDLSGEESS
jgi:hypothetical protein